MNSLIILAKAHIPGRVKTRLCPPLSSEATRDLIVENPYRMPVWNGDDPWGAASRIQDG